MKFLIYAGIGIATLWLQLTLAPLVALFGMKANLLLLTVLVIGLRWSDPWYFLYGAIAGLAADVFSHGVLGIYGTSYFLVALLARLTGVSVYENSLLFGLVGVFGLSLAEGLISLSLLELLDSTVPWWAWLLTTAILNAAFNSLWSPLAFFALGRLEHLMKTAET